MQPQPLNQAQVPEQPQITTPPKRRTRWMISAIVIVVLAIAVAVGMYLWSYRTGSSVASGQVAFTEGGMSPKTIKVKQGQSITWVNQDGADHKIVGDSPELQLDSEESLASGDAYIFTFEKPGTYTYHDPLNPAMFAGTVIVE